MEIERDFKEIALEREKIAKQREAFRQTALWLKKKATG